MTQHIARYAPDGTMGCISSVRDDWVAFQTAAAGGGVVVLDELPADARRFLNENYVIAGAVVAKVSQGLAVSKLAFTANGTDEVTISGIPNGAIATISGAVSAGPETITDGTLVITSTVIGAITVNITCAPAYFDWSVTLNAD